MGAKPGVTRHISNIQVSYDPATFLVDTPGIMVPKVETPDMGLKLALCCTSSTCTSCYALLVFAHVVRTLGAACVKDTVVPLDILADFLLFQLNRLGNSRYVDVSPRRPCHCNERPHAPRGLVSLSVVTDVHVVLQVFGLEGPSDDIFDVRAMCWCAVWCCGERALTP